MTFDTNFFLLALFYGVLSTGAFAAFSSLASERNKHVKAIGIGLFVIVLLATGCALNDSILLFQGAMAGAYPLVALILIPALVAGLVCKDHGLRTLVGYISAGVVFLLLIGSVQIGYSTWFPAG